MIGTYSGKDEFGLFTGTGTNDNDICIETNDASRWDVFQLMNVSGVCDVIVTLDGTNWSSAISLSDLGGVSLDPVIVTAEDRMYGFAGKFKAIRVLQASGVAVTSVSLACGKF